MSRTLVALAFVALLLMPLAAADPPVAKSWSPFVAGAKILSFAASRGSNVTAVGLDGCAAPAQCPFDLVILDRDNGYTRQIRGVGQQALGRTFVAVSDNGATVASLGNDTYPQPGNSGLGGIDPLNPSVPSPNPTPPTTVRLRLGYNRIAPGGNWTDTPTAGLTNLTVLLDGSPVGLALASDGDRVAVVTSQSAGVSNLSGYIYSGRSLDRTFNLQIAGDVTGFAASGDLGQLFLAVNAVDPNGTRPTLVQVPFLQGTSSAAYSTGLNGTAMGGVATNDDGTIVAVGSDNGRVLLFRHGIDTTPAVVPTNATGKARFAMTPDGARVFVAQGGNLTLIDIAPATARWSGPAGGDVSSLALNRTGGLLAAATSVGVLGFGSQDASPLWTIEGPASGVALSPSGDEIAFSQGQKVSAQRISHAFALEYPGTGKTGTTQKVGIAGSTTFDAQIRNAGSAPELVAIRIPTDAAFTAMTTPEQVYVKPGETKEVRIDVAPAAGFHGTRAFTATAVALTSNLTDELSFSFQVSGTANVRLAVNETELIAAADGPTVFALGVINTGDKDTAVGIRATQRVTSGAAWTLVMEPTSFTSFGHSRSTVRVQLTPPADVANGTADSVTFNLEGPDVGDQATITLRVNPQLGIDVGAAGRVKFIPPGRTAFFNVTVTNTGSLQRNFEAYFTLTPTGKTTWAVDMPTEPFALAPAATKTLTIRVVAPFDVTPQDHLSILVTARSVVGAVNETRVLGNVTLFANGDVPPITTPSTTPDRGIPLLAPALVAGVVALAAMLRRRRS